MSLTTDNLLLSLNTLLASGKEIPATDLRAFEAQVIAAIGVLEARARGNRIFYTSGKPGDGLGLEGDLGVNQDNGDFYYFANGTFTFLFNGAGKVGVFEPIAPNAFGAHPAFTSQGALNTWLLGHAGSGTPPAVPTISSFAPATAAVEASVTITGTNFGATPGAAGLVKFNGILANVLSWSATSITAKVPTGGATGLLSVTTSAGTAVSAAVFTVATATPSAPTVVFDSASRTLSASHPDYALSELEYRHGASAGYVPYAAQLVDAAAHIAGEWQYRVSAAPGRASGEVANSPAITSSSTSPVGSNFTVVDSDYWNSETSLPRASGPNQLNAFAFVVYDLTGAGTLTISGVTTGSYNVEAITLVSAGVRIGGITESALAAAGSVSFQINTPGRYQIVTGTQSVQDAAQTYTYTNLTTVAMSGGLTGNKVYKPTSWAKGFAIGGDSTTVGGPLAQPYWTGFARLFSLQYTGCKLVNLGWAGHRIWYDMLSDNAISEYVARVVAELTGVADPNFLSFGGINDAEGIGGGATSWAAQRRKLFIALKNAIPALRIHLVLPKDQIAGGLYNTATVLAVQDLPYVSLTSSDDYLLTSDLVDNAHNNEFGERKLANGVAFDYNLNVTIPTAINFGNADFAGELGTDYTKEFIPALADGNAPLYFHAGGTAATANGKLVVDGTNSAATVVRIKVTGTYRLTMELTSISGGNAQVVSTSNLQINTYFDGPAAGASPATLVKDAVAHAGDVISFTANVNGTGTASIEKVTLQLISS